MLALVLKALGAILFPALATGPCEIAYAQGKPFAICTVERQKHRIDLVLRSADGSLYGSLTRVKKAYPKAVFLGNAGMYHASGEPVGLLVQDAKTLSPLNRDAGHGNFFMKPNGVFWIDQKGFHVDESMAFDRQPHQVKLATQSGPMLLIKGKRHPAFRQGSKHQKIRNGVGVSKDGQVAYLVMSLVPVSFWQMSGVFSDRLDVQDALYLDGVVSSMMAPGVAREGGRQLGPIFVVRAR